MIRFSKKLAEYSRTLEYLKFAPRVMSDTLQATPTGREEKDYTAYDLVMQQTRRRKYAFHWANQGTTKFKTGASLRVGFDGNCKPWYIKHPKMWDYSPEFLPEKDKRQWDFSKKNETTFSENLKLGSEIFFIRPINIIRTPTSNRPGPFGYFSSDRLEPAPKCTCGSFSH